MELSKLGEFGLIELFKKTKNKRRSTIIGIGDDCAVIQIPVTSYQIPKYLLITTDALVENVHFRRKGLSFLALGEKAMAANVSDIAAMGGIPTHAVITVGLSKSVTVKDAKTLYKGIKKIADSHGIDIVGGDTVSSPNIFISITLLGEVEKEYLMTRSGAKIGDVICVTGVFGGPAAGKYDMRYAYHVSRIEEARLLAKRRIVNSMIDSSDGLVRSILEICKSSKVGAVISTFFVPKAKGATLDQALYGGEEYELVFTLPFEKLEKLPKELKKLVSIVGEIVPKKQGVKLLAPNGKMISPKGGFEHFKL